MWELITKQKVLHLKLFKTFKNGEMATRTSERNTKQAKIQL